MRRSSQTRRGVAGIVAAAALLGPLGLREAAAGNPLAKGAPCASASACQSGICADGVCCDALCNAGPCSVCAKAAGAVADGTCTLLDGTDCKDPDPCTLKARCQHGACVASKPVACHADLPCHVAFCDPQKGACADVLAAVGAPCDDRSGCTVNAACQPDGSCVGVPVVCPPADPCHDAGVCVPEAGCDPTPAPWCGQIADAGAAPALHDGALCSADVHCKSGHCVSGVCCDSACASPCFSCALGSSLGKCVPEPRGVDLEHHCAPEGSCVATCDGDGGCVSGNTGFACHPARCVDDHTGIGEALCNAGVCDVAARAPFECRPYLCAAALGRCAASMTCQSVRDCAPGDVCDQEGRCVRPLYPGGDDGGCGCRAGLGSPDAVVAWSALGLFAALAARVRRVRHARWGRRP